MGPGQPGREPKRVIGATQNVVRFERVVVEAFEPDAGLNLETRGLPPEVAVPLVHGHGTTCVGKPSGEAKANGASADYRPALSLCLSLGHTADLDEGGTLSQLQG